MTNFLETALAAHSAGLCVVPPRMDGSKAPLPRTWKTYQQTRPDPAQLRRWYSDGLTGIGAVPGAVSGNLEVFEFDEAETYWHFKDSADEAGLGPIIARLEQGYVESSPSGGRHWLYRCDEIGGNTKLATRPEGADDHGRPLVKTLIETRGEGGFIIMAPSSGKVHPTGKPYRLLAGNFATIPRLTPAERRELFNLARTFHVPAKIPLDPVPAGAKIPLDPVPAVTTGERPGDAFNARARWSDVLEPHEWIRVYERDGMTYWRRPGKNRGISAATNWQGRDLFYVWSSSTPFDTEKPYQKFMAYATLNHDGDTKAAAKALAAKGYGGPAAKKPSETNKKATTKDEADPEDRNTGVDWLENNRLRVLKVRPGQLPELADEVEKTLSEHDGNIFQRSGYLARVATARAETVQGIKRPAGNAIIVPIDLDYLLDRINRQVGFIKYSERKEDYVPCNAPRTLGSTLLSRSGLWNFKSLVSVITAPTLRPDGSILFAPGYDEQTGMLFVESEPFPAIPENPDRMRGRAALDYLLGEVLSGFAFAAPNDRAAALSAILTALVRPALRTAPMHVFSAPQKGSGKTLLANCVALVATGKEATAMVFTADPEEQRKRMMTVLLSGDQVLCLDNLEGVLAGDALCAALTGPTFSDRLLGTQRQGTAPTCVTWLATGNNLSVGGDMTRRVVYCTIDPRCERPEEREFSRNLSEWIPAHRPALVVAGLTALRAYIAAGRPPQPIPNFGSFEEWSSLVRSALVWLGEADPMASRDAIEDADPVRHKLHDTLLAWWHAFRTAPATSHELALAANATATSDEGETVFVNPLLRETLATHFSDRRGDLSTKHIGDFVAKHERRTVCGARFDPAGFYGARKRWVVAVTDQSLLDDELRKFLNPSANPS